MKILLAYEWCLVGGVEAFMVSLAHVLKGRGHECELFFFTRGPMERQLPPGMVAHFGDVADCMRLVRARRFDIVHACSSDWRIGISSVRSVSAKLVLTGHGMVIPGWNSTNCDAFACCSRWQAERQAAFTDLPVHTVLNGVNTERFNPAPPPGAEAEAGPVVAWVGRGPDITHKRIDRLAAIAPALQRAGVRLWIADPFGPAALAEVMPEAARVLRGAAEFWEGVPRAELPDFYRRVAASGGCVLSTSAREGLSMALIEAQACGCPVIGPDVLGINEVIDPGRGGVLYPFGLADEGVAQLVLAAVDDAEGMRRRGTECAVYARAKFGLGRMVDDYERIYGEALGGAGARGGLGLRARLWLAPAVDWGGYVERRWTAGLSLYDISVRLAGQGEWDLARRVARISAETCPSLYMRPRRVAHLLKVLLRPGFLANGRGADGAGVARS